MSTKIVFGGEVYGGKSSVRSKGKNKWGRTWHALTTVDVSGTKALFIRYRVHLIFTSAKMKEIKYCRLLGVNFLYLQTTEGEFLQYLW
jgi:hypothetical protein